MCKKPEIWTNVMEQMGGIYPFFQGVLSRPGLM